MNSKLEPVAPEKGLDLERYAPANIAECTAIIKYKGKKETVVPHCIRDIICSENFQVKCEAPVEVKRKKRSIHNPIDYCLKENLFSNKRLINQLKTIIRDKREARQTHLTPQIVQDLVDEFNTFERVKQFGVKFIAIRLNGT